MESFKKYLTPMNLIIAAVVAVVVIGGGYFLLSSNEDTTPTQATTEQVSEDLIEDEDSLSMMIPVVLDEQNDSGQSGTATLTEEDGVTTVSVELVDYTEDVSQPAHLHAGSCLALGDIVYPLTNVLDGESVTVLDVDLETIKSETLALNVHKSADEISVYVSCGDLQ